MHHHGKRESEPTSIKVVLKFSKLIKNEIAAEPEWECYLDLNHVPRRHSPASTKQTSTWQKVALVNHNVA